jgi:hypothetical protein
MAPVDPSDRHFDPCHVALGVLKEDEAVFKRVKSGVVHVRDNTHQLMPTESHSCSQAEGVVHATGNRPQAGLQIDHADNTDPSLE